MNQAFLDTLCCPLTGNRMIDPVILVADGVTYERFAVERWIAETGTGPDGRNLPEDKRTLVPNQVMRTIINAVSHL